MDVFGLLKRHESLECIQLEAPIPSNKLSLHWKELSTPKTALSFRDLAGKKLSDYKFQYLGHFQYGDQEINTVSESFSADFSERRIHDCSVQTTGWVNCTWLIDFLINAESIEIDPLRNEKLCWKQDKKTISLSLDTKAIDSSHTEHQKLCFNKEFDAVSWQHFTLFA